MIYLVSYAYWGDENPYSVRDRPLQIGNYAMKTPLRSEEAVREQELLFKKWHDAKEAKIIAISVLPEKFLKAFPRPSADAAIKRPVR